MSVFLKQNLDFYMCVFRCVPRLPGARRGLKRASDDPELPLRAAVNYHMVLGTKPHSVTGVFNHCASSPVPEYQLS